MKIIAIASNNEEVSQHFGYCEGFHLFKVENNLVIERRLVPNPGHKPGFLPSYLHEQGVNIIIAGGMGGSAIELFRNNEIEVITGANGSVEGALQQYLNGTLQSTNSSCNEHMHHEENA